MLTGKYGVLLKDILQQAEITMNSAKLLREYYSVFTDCDRYEVLHSWNEIFNSSKAAIFTGLKKRVAKIFHPLLSPVA